MEVHALPRFSPSRNSHRRCAPRMQGLRQLSASANAVLRAVDLPEQEHPLLAALERSWTQGARTASRARTVKVGAACGVACDM